MKNIGSKDQNFLLLASLVTVTLILCNIPLFLKNLAANKFATTEIKELSNQVEISELRKNEQQLWKNIKEINFDENNDLESDTKEVEPQIQLASKPRLGDQTRYQRWDAGLIVTPDLISEEDLRICLMKQTRRSIYRGGYLQFENLTYRGENLAGYAGESVVLRYEPRDITTILVYLQKGSQEEFLARAYAQDLETEELSLDEAKAMSRRIRQAGKTVSNRSILAEVRDRETFVKQKKTKKERQKEEQVVVEKASSERSRTAKKPVVIEPEKIEMASVESSANTDMPEVFDYEQMREDYGW